MANPSAGDRRIPEATLAQAAAAWAASRWVRVGYLSVRYREAGVGVPLVLVHGLGVSADYWMRNGPPLAAAGLRVLAPDLPGFGLTDGPEEGLGVEAQAEAVHRWLSALEVGPAVLVGHSLSCQTILELAARHPEDVLGLVLAAPTGDGDTLPRLARQALGLARDVRRESLKLSAFVLQAYARAGPLRVLRTWRRGAEHDPFAILARVRAPGIVVLGEHDPVVDRDFAERLAHGLPGGEVVIVPGAAHGVIFEDTGVFNTALLAFARRIDRRNREG